MVPTEVNFVLGPAGTGKTYRAIQTIQHRLAKAPEGPPLLFLAPKQATYQIESQLLQAEPLQGFTRLQILSFPRLAEYILSEFAPDQTQILSEDGRIMIIRSLLNRYADELKAFGPTATLPSFIEELGAFLIDLQRHQISPGELKRLAARPETNPSLRDKLHDLSLLIDRYREWMERSQIKDTEFLLELATRQLSERRNDAATSTFYVEELWLDGFDEMTPQEIELLSAVVRRSQKSHLAFSVDCNELENSSWLNIWQTTAKTYQRCRQRFEGDASLAVHTTHLGREANHTRYANSPILRHIEAEWTHPKPSTASSPEADSEIEIVRCRDREAEVIQAARRIRQAVRTQTIRYRQILVILRQITDYAPDFRRIFQRYQIPYFVDQREPIHHHPAIRLTSCVLRLLAFRWRTVDVLAALKTELLSPDWNAINELEALAQRFGIQAKQWSRPLSTIDPSLARLDPFCSETLAPLRKLESYWFPGTDGTQPITGTKLVEGLLQFWESIQLGETLIRWDHEGQQQDALENTVAPAVHSGTWEALQSWLENVALAFADIQCSLAEWRPILDAGLSRLTVGIIPPTSDQVLVGSVDRTKSPDVKLTLVLGMNEGVFPAPPQSHLLVTEMEREALGDSFSSLLPLPKEQLAREQFYAYQACTRAQTKTIVSYANHADDGKPLSPSPAIAHLKRLVPSLSESVLELPISVNQAEHVGELVQPLFTSVTHQRVTPDWANQLTVFDADHLTHTTLSRDARQSAELPPKIARSLYLDENQTLQTSVSRLELFAACPFRFFVHSGLRCDEGHPYELDPRRIGSFQHLILETFHNRLSAQQCRWRDIDPLEAKELIQTIATESALEFEHQIFASSHEAGFMLETIIARLQELIAVLIDWMTQYEFDPVAVELSFGGARDEIGAWKVPLDSGVIAFAGKVDRLDLHRIPDTNTAKAVIIDYKSSGKRLDPILLHHGIQLQLLAYLNVVAQQTDIAAQLGVNAISPAGVFFVPLQGISPRQRNRDRAQLNHSEQRPKAFQHTGAFDLAELRHLDNRQDQATGDQIRYHLKRDGTPKKTDWHAMTSQAFAKTMQRTEDSIREMGTRILSGVTSIDPYEHRNMTACQYCAYRSICRIDPAEHEYRVLELPEHEAGKNR